MRSRYSAFVLGRLDYIEASMQGQAAKNFDRDAALRRFKAVSWEGLRILSTRMKNPKVGYVSFEAWYWVQGERHVLREKSEFHKINDRWFYTDGKLLNPNSKQF